MTLFSAAGLYETFINKFTQNFITDNRWRYITTGLQNTLIITIFALVIGLIIGFLVAFVRVTNHNTGKLKILNAICKIYISIIRGTPVVTQLMIIYFVVFASLPVSKLFVAIISFGINSGAYVAEIFRSGIMSIDPGQMEAGRSLGLSYSQTMWRIVMPQAIKNVLPTLGNECITLLKETSISGYIALHDLNYGGNIIRSRTYDALFPLLAVAIIYFLLVKILEFLVSRLERRLAKSDRR